MLPWLAVAAAAPGTSSVRLRLPGADTWLAEGATSSSLPAVEAVVLADERSLPGGGCRQSSHRGIKLVCYLPMGKLCSAHC